VLSNLFDNALKYSRNAVPPTVRVASEPLPNGVRLVVSDNGIGFDMKYHDRLFGLFNRLVRQEDFEGTGAGLAIARKVTEKMGGVIRAQSSPGAGATFVVELPSGVPCTDAARSAMTRHRRVRPILLVEDNPMDVDLTLEAFREQGVANPITVCRDGEEALQYVAEHGSASYPFGFRRGAKASTHSSAASSSPWWPPSSRRKTIAMRPPPFAFSA